MSNPIKLSLKFEFEFDDEAAMAAALDTLNAIGTMPKKGEVASIEGVDPDCYTGEERIGTTTRAEGYHCDGNSQPGPQYCVDNVVYDLYREVTVCPGGRKTYGNVYQVEVDRIPFLVPDGCR